CAQLWALAYAAFAAARCGHGAATDREILERLVEALHGKGQMVRPYSPFAHYAKGLKLPAHGRHCGGANHILARKNWRRAQLGLPLLLAARCDIYIARLHKCRLHRRSRCVAALVVARGCRIARTIADHVWRGRRTPPGRTGAGLVERV